MIKSIHHTAISTGDFERALAFYRDLLGFEMVSELNWPAGVELADTITGLEGSAARSVMLRASNTSIELFEFSSPTPKPGDPKRPVCDHGITHIGFEVDDIDAEYERLKAAGMSFHCPPQDLGASRVTYGRDPDGNVLELWQSLAL
jgi:catechol 2,3-dioxygenase-like lactoylglutathione lyase family enzyme